jgi:prepilin-type N-terminal cleavage/methylation domain-containing protein
MHRSIKDNRGLTLLELLVALVISSLIVAALYRVFIGQQRNYRVHGEVLDMRQNMRGSLSNMIRELRMAGFGSVRGALPMTLVGPNDVQNIVNQNFPAAGWITIVAGSLTSDVKTPALADIASSSSNTITVNVPAGTNMADFFRKDTDNPGMSYISIGGIESHQITNIAGNQLTLRRNLGQAHPAGTLIFPIRIISYGPAGQRDDHTGAGVQSPENIQSIQYNYNAASQTIAVTATGVTDNPDPQYKSGDGRRTRQISSNIQLRNLAP